MSEPITAEFLRSIPTSDLVARVYFHRAADALDAKDRELRRRNNTPTRRHQVDEALARASIAAGMSQAGRDAALTLIAQEADREGP